MIKSAAALLLAVFFSGCSPVYVLKSAVGHASLLSRRRSVEKLLRSPETSEAVREKLKLVQEIRSFAFAKMSLSRSRDYSTISKIKGSHVSYLVTACRKTSFEPYLWKFPFLGGFPYLGYFNRSDAVRHSRKLEKKGLDVHVAGAAAYNTPLWFSDPLPEPLLKEPPGELADLLIHELTHGTIFFKNKMEFNEAVASFIGERGAEDFLERRFGPESLEMAEFRSFRERDRRWIKVMADLRHDLDILYQSSVSEAEKLKGRESVFERGRGRLEAISPLGKDFVLNNAVIMAYGLYHRDFSAFQAVYEVCRRDWPCTIKKFRELNKSDPEAALRRLSPAAEASGNTTP